jgi:alkanesulfonate monooxygenase SsuD/methylene tetrahydromethanopterin reductase-like flavin-dependent oxidoreductase (luciferase family)
MQRTVWFVGDPASVAERIREQRAASGGFGTLLQLGRDDADPGAREGWFRSMERLATEVMPRLQDVAAPAA